MECPGCGYENMDAYADGERIIYTCPECDADAEYADAEESDD